jgi:hypothetical protein
MAVAERGGIFVSYRRQESSHLAGRLYDRLADRFGEDQVFIDVDALEPGVDFAEEIFRAVASCQVLLAIIGPAWTSAADGRGRRRLEDPDDIVRLEIEAALARAVRVIPILVEGAVMPARQDLPESLAGLARRNAFLIRHETFRYDAGRLITALERVLAAPAPAEVPGPRGTDDYRAAGNAPGQAAQKGPAPSAGNAAWADRLFADGEREASSLADSYLKASALGQVASSVAASDPDRAERIASSITEESEKASALGEVARVRAETDPERAERIARSLGDGNEKVQALCDVARAMAESDPDRAERILVEAERTASSLAGGLDKVFALTRLAREAANVDPGRAARLLAEAENTASALANRHTKVLALDTVARAVAHTSS